LFFCVVRAWRRLRLLFFELRAYGSPASRHPIFGFFVLRAHGSPAIMAPYFCCARGAEAEVAFLCCAHMGVPRSWHPIFVARAAPRRRLLFCVARTWESRDHGTLYFCCARAVEVEVKETRSGHVKKVAIWVVLRSSLNAFYTIRGGFKKSNFGNLTQSGRTRQPD
jgi:hypothetical protein